MVEKRSIYIASFGLMRSFNNFLNDTIYDRE